MVEDADQREEACEICDSKCQTETGLLVSWVSCVEGGCSQESAVVLMWQVGGGAFRREELSVVGWSCVCQQRVTFQQW